jgi:hypothetical protein
MAVFHLRERLSGKWLKVGFRKAGQVHMQYTMDIFSPTGRVVMALVLKPREKRLFQRYKRITRRFRKSVAAW